jgi:16S rRNA processing protein RimM
LADSDNLVAVGKLGGTYGYEGWMKLLPLTDFPERLKNLHEVYITEPGLQKSIVEAVKNYRDIFLIKLQGIDSKEQAQPYVSRIINVEMSQVFPLPEGYYYHFQLEGLAVYDRAKGYLGKIDSIIETRANDIYLVNSEKYGEVLIPAIKQVVIDIDIEKKIMQVDLLPGLVEE